MQSREKDVEPTFANGFREGETSVINPEIPNMTAGLGGERKQRNARASDRISYNKKKKRERYFPRPR